MRKLYLLDICERDGLFIFNKDEVLFSEIAKKYTVVNTSSDNISNLNDLIINIADEHPECVLIKINSNCSQLICDLLKGLSDEGIVEIVLLAPQMKKRGIVSLNNISYHVITSIRELEEKEYSVIYEMQEIFDGVVKYNPDYSETMQNGIEAFLTGVYPTAGQLSNLKHVLLQEENLNENVTFSELFDINSAIIYSNYDSNRFKLIKEMPSTFYQHIHQIKNDSVYFDNTDSHLKVNCINYADYIDQDDAFLKISNGSDILALLNDVDTYLQSGNIKVIGATFINACALGAAQCVLTKLFRGVLDSAGNLMPCLGCSQNIGSIRDDSFELIRNASRIANKEKIRRNCEECENSQFCSKCALLPDGITRQEYCSLINHDGLFDYVYKTIIVGKLFGNGKIVPKQDLKKLIISSPYNPLVVQKTELSGTEFTSKKRSMLIAVQLNNNYYVFGYKLSKLYQTDKRFVYIAELYDMNLPIEKAVELYSKKFDIALVHAKAHVIEAYQMIKDAVIV